MNENSTPLVSVIVLNLNGEKVIDLCLTHLFQQTYPNFEIIVVDNHSSDRSVEILENYRRQGKLALIRSQTNLGCPGGRNLGVCQAHGEWVAFIDNDGYADPRWLEAAIQPFQQDSRVGAVAPVVFFNRNRAVLNGAGGTINWQGYGGDYAYHEVHEFARLPEDVLYPMGCGMVVRRAVLDTVGPWDDSLLNYYDDTELGFRIWKSGFRVVVAPNAWVYHEFNYSNQFVLGKSLLTEKGRIRTALKYFPQRHVPRWLLHEAWHVATQTVFAYPQLRAWIWNLMHLPSALKWRSRFPARFEAFERLVSPAWGWFRFPVPIHALYSPELRRLGPSLLMADRNDASLNYGWYPTRRDLRGMFRWTSARASAVFRLPRSTQSLLLTLKTRGPQRVHLVVRRWGDRLPIWSAVLTDFNPGAHREERHVPCHLEAGDYELLFHSTPTFALGRHTIGVGIARVEFE